MKGRIYFCSVGDDLAVIRRVQRRTLSLLCRRERTNHEDIMRIAESVGKRSSWDFSRVRDEREPVPWDYTEVVRRYLRPDDRVLDLGTGGGERFLTGQAIIRVELSMDFG